MATDTARLSPLILTGSRSAFSAMTTASLTRVLTVDWNEGLLFLNSGADRVLALDRDGKVVRDTGSIEGLNPGGGNFGPDGRFYLGLRSARTIMALAIGLDAPGEHVLRLVSCRFRADSRSGLTAGFSLPPA
jgi:hypothetical protein